MPLTLPDTVEPGGNFPVSTTEHINHAGETLAGIIGGLLGSDGSIVFGEGPPPAGEGDPGTAWIDTAHPDLPLYERTPDSWETLGELTGIDEAKLFGILPLAASTGSGSVTFGPNRRQRGTASGTGAVSLGRQNRVWADYAMAIGKRCQAHASGSYALAIGDDTQTRRAAEFAHGQAPGNDFLIHQRGWLQNGCVVRDAGPTEITSGIPEGWDTNFTVFSGQQYKVTASVNAATATGLTAEFELKFTARYPHGGEVELVGEVSTKVIHSDVDAWDVYPVATNGDYPKVELHVEGRADEQVRWDVHWDFHETTLPGLAPPTPNITPGSMEGSIIFGLEPPAEVPVFEGHRHRFVVFRGTSADSLRRMDKYDPERSTWADNGARHFEEPQPGVDYYYRFAYINMSGILSPKTQVFGPYSI